MTPDRNGTRRGEGETLGELQSLARWLESVAKVDPEEIVADGGITAGMVISQEARTVQLPRLRALIDAVAAPPIGEWREIEQFRHLKGLRRSPKYFPAIGETCRVSGPNCDDADGYTWLEQEVLWRDDLFIVTRTPGCWPTITKLELALFEPTPNTSINTTPSSGDGG